MQAHTVLGEMCRSQQVFIFGKVIQTQYRGLITFTSPLFSANGSHTNGALQFSLMKTSPPSLLIPSFRALLSAGKLGC